VDPMNQKIGLIIGATGGLGKALTENLLSKEAFSHVYGAARRPEALPSHAKLTPIQIDLEDEDSIAQAAQFIRERHPRLHLLITTVGFLHDTDMTPEKRLDDLDPEQLARSFRVNAIGPALIFKHFHHLLRHPEPSVMASISARVGSIEDNLLGGWYGYRASKAALNQIVRTAAVEMRRKAPKCAIVALHPGTVNTPLSEPFQRNVPEGKLFTPERSAAYLLDVIEGLSEDDTGKFYAWDGQPIPW